MQTNKQARVVIVAYRPKTGKQADLLALTRDHLSILRAENLVTEMPATIVQAADGTVIEVFEWAAGGMEKAHGNPAALALWERYAGVCDYVPLNTLPEAGQMFAAFRRVEI